jgi:hypothetical protein
MNAVAERESMSHMVHGHPRDWLNPMLAVWKVQYLRAMRGYQQFADGMRHFDGWPASTILGKIRAEGEGAGQGGTFKQHFSEVYFGDGLLIWRAMQEMPIGPKEVLYAKLLSYESVSKQIKLLGITWQEHGTRLDCAYYYLAGRLSRPLEND